MRRDHTAADALYLTYDGILEPLGRSQVIAYLLELTREGLAIELLSFEKPEDCEDPERLGRLEAELAQNGIRWTRLAYHRRPRIVSTAFDVLLGLAVAVRRSRKAGVRLVHARSYVPALIAVAVKRLTGARFLFDMRGFWPEERVEMGIFRAGGLLFRVSKWFERAFLARADQVVVLTERAREVLAGGPIAGRPEKLAVIPCAVDIRRFPPRTPSTELATRWGLSGKVVVGNLGAINRRYLLREMFRFGARLKKRIPELCFVYLTRQDPTPLFRAAEEEGLPAESLCVASARPEEVPEWLSLLDLGVFFLQPTYAAQASSFTKLGELLAAGVPVVTNRGVGDVETVVCGSRVGVVLPDLSDRELDSAVDWAVNALPPPAELRRRCREAAIRHFSLEKASATYRRIYQGLLGHSSATAERPGEENPLPCAASSAR